MSESQQRNRRQLKFGKSLHENWFLFAGDCNFVNEFLATKSEKSIFLLFQYLNSVLRSFGHVIFANNPVSGFIIMLAIASADYRAALAAVLTSSLSFFFAKVLQQDILGNLNGFFSYNAVLHAVISVGYLPTIYPTIDLDEPKFWMFLFFTTLLSVYFTSSFANMFRYLWHYPIPCFTVPFNVLQYILIFCLLHNSIPPKILSSHLFEPLIKSDYNNSDLAKVITNDSSINNSIVISANSLDANLRKRRNINETSDLEKEMMDDQKLLQSFFENGMKNVSAEPEEVGTNETDLDWGEMLSGTVVALSEVYGLNNVPCAVLMYLALIIYSPTTAFFCYFGSFLGTLVGVSLSTDFENVYNGTWGYNGLLCGGALAGFGFVLTSQSAFLALTAILFCALFQHFITPLFVMFHVPIFHIPFIVTTVIFLLVTSEVEKALPRPSIYTYAEKHRQDFNSRVHELSEACTVQCRSTATTSC